MTWAETKENIERVIRAGRHDHARSLIHGMKGKLPFDPEVCLQLSDWYLRLGLAGNALKVLGAERPSSELEQAGPAELRIQCRLAYMLSHFGATESALRILDSATPWLVQKLTPVDSFWPVFYRYRADLFIRVYDYARAHEAYSHALAVTLAIGRAAYPQKLMRLGLADCLDGMGQSNEAIRIATQVIAEASTEESLLLGIGHQARGEYLFRRGKMKKARADFDEAWKFFPREVHSKDAGFLAKWSGALHWLDGNRKQAEKELSLASAILGQDRVRPTSLIEVLYWQVQMAPTLVHAESHRVLNTHPCQSPYGYLTGRSFPGTPSDKMRVDPWVRARLPKHPNGHDCWVLSQGVTSSAFYREFVSPRPSRQQIDLVAGSIQGPRSKGNVLSPLRSNALMLLALAGRLGMNSWALIDHLYHGQWISPDSAMQRLEDLIQSLREEGFRIERKLHAYSWTPPANAAIILPMDLKYRGLLYRLSHQSREFKRADLEEQFATSPANAKLWVRNWIEQGRLLRVGAGRKASYEIRA